MFYCLDPNCSKPENPDGTQFCQQCGSKLVSLLRGRYRIISAIGQGGFGKTYLAEDEDRCGDRCIVKQFAPAPGIQSNPQILQKATELFNQEAKRLLVLEEHPQIPTLYAYFQENNYLYLVQQFIKGQTLKEELKQRLKNNPNPGLYRDTEIIEMLRDLLPVLEFVHQRGVIHRDIKPDNIIRRESDGKLVLIDFGVAKQTRGTMLTSQGTTVGTMGYAPIEQILRGTALPASDLYSLAVTCIRLLTGCLPQENGSDLLYDHLEGCWIWRQHLPPVTTVSSELGKILDKMLKNAVKERYQSAAEVLAVLNPGKRGNTPSSSALASTILLNPQPLPPLPQTTPSFSPLSKGKNLQSFEFYTVTVDAVGRQNQHYKHTAEFLIQDLGNGVILEMVSVSGGTFMMGSLDTKKERSDSEIPLHPVTIAPFFMSKYPITQAQWRAVAVLPQVKISLNPEPSQFKGNHLPVENVSWYDAVEFCDRLTQKTGQSYRLPSEAEWEYSCRAGTTTPFYFGETIITDLANYHGNYTYGSGPKGVYRHKTTSVGNFPPNAFGLCDMHGNVWEWCADPWHENYNHAPFMGKVWSADGDSDRRLLRGGSWQNGPWLCRSAFRNWNKPSYRNCNVGFRIAFS